MRDVAPFRRRPVSLTALIDVVFLLLLFFMLTSTFSSFAEIELNQPSGLEVTGEAQPRRAFVQLGAERLVLDGAPVGLDALADRLEPGLVLVDLDADVTSQRLVDLLARLRGREGLNVLVLD